MAFLQSHLISQWNVGKDQDPCCLCTAPQVFRSPIYYHKSSFNPVMKLLINSYSGLHMFVLSVMPQSDVCKTRKGKTQYSRYATSQSPQQLLSFIFFFCPQSCASMLQFLPLFIKVHAWFSSLFSTFLKSSNFELLAVLIVR